MRLVLRLLAVVAALQIPQTLATTVSFSEVPSAWRLQNYIATSSAPELLFAFFTQSVTYCTSGALTLPSTASNDDRNRFWLTVMNAKNNGTQVFVYYDSATCIISSFGVLEQ